MFLELGLEYMLKRVLVLVFFMIVVLVWVIFLLKFRNGWRNDILCCELFVLYDYGYCVLVFCVGGEYGCLLCGFLYKCWFFRCGLVVVCGCIFVLDGL